MDRVLRIVSWVILNSLYRLRIHGRQNVPARGGTLLVSNHVSWLDGLLISYALYRRVQMVAWAANFQNPVLHWIARRFRYILLGTRPKALAASLRVARETLRSGGLICVFPEGGITRTGQLMGFRPGLLQILAGTDAAVVPVYLDGLWGSIFSFERGRFFWKWPLRWRLSIDIHFGEPLAKVESVHQVRRSVAELGAHAVRSRPQTPGRLVQTFLHNCRKRLRSAKVADSTGAELTGGQLLTRTLVLRRLLRRHVLRDDERFVAVLLPPSVGAVVVNAALAVDRRVSVNLNYTASPGALESCLAQAGVRHVLTSRRFTEKLNFTLDAPLVYLEDLRDRPTVFDKTLSATLAYACPTRLLGRLLGLHRIDRDELLTVIFTSGSTGQPKGVMLTHGNVDHNVRAVEQVVRLTPRDVLLGILPFFHSFGYTVTMWAVLAIDVKGVYHFNPLDAQQVAKLCRDHGGTLLLATPTFLRTYSRRCDPEDFRTLEVVVAGAEKLPKDICDAFEERFGIRPIEGYGTTELSPLVSVNIPPSRSADDFQIGWKEGTVGRPVPEVAAKITDLDTGVELGVGRPGMLWITGPNVMLGYLGREDATAEVIKDGWYMTGDVALIDEDGFIRITGRESRFSKIGGEMVPHLQIEEVLAGVAGLADDGAPRLVVTAVPDAKKGERLIVIHAPLDQPPDALCRQLSEAGLPNLFIPSPDSFFEVDQLPVLGSGKIDLRKVKELALREFGPDRHQN